MSQVFISYKRITSAMLAQYIRRELESKGISTFLDVRSMDGAGVFPKRLKDAIDQAQIMVCLLADSTLESLWVQEEIQYALKKGKALIPIFQESFQRPSIITSEWIEILLQSDGVHILDQKNIYIDAAIEMLVELIRLTPLSPQSHPSSNGLRQPMLPSFAETPGLSESVSDDLLPVREKWVELQKTAFRLNRNLPILLDHTQALVLTETMLVIAVYNPIFQEKINDRKEALEKAATSVFERKLSVDCVLITENDKPIPIETIRQNWVDLQKASFRLNRNLPPLLDHVNLEAVETNRIIVSARNPIFKQKLEDPDRYRSLLQALNQVFKQTIVVRIVLTETAELEIFLHQLGGKRATTSTVSQPTLKVVYRPIGTLSDDRVQLKRLWDQLILFPGDWNVRIAFGSSEIEFPDVFVKNSPILKQAVSAIAGVEQIVEDPPF